MLKYFLLLIVVPLLAVCQTQRMTFDQRMQGVLDTYDTDKDGVLTKAELSAGPVYMLERMDANKDGKLDAAELKNRPNGARPQGRSGQGQAGRGQAGGARPAGGRLPDISPALGDCAPDFSLKTLEGEAWTLSQQFGKKPILLIFGSYTCPPFRDALAAMEKVHQDYSNRITSVFVYIEEAHPEDGRAIGMNARQGIVFNQPKTLKEREVIATTCQRSVKVTMPVVVDTIDNAVQHLYNSKPNRAYVLSPDGGVLYKGPKSPDGTQAGACREALDKALAE